MRVLACCLVVVVAVVGLVHPARGRYVLDRPTKHQLLTQDTPVKETRLDWVGEPEWRSDEDQSHETDDVNKDPDWMPDEYYDEDYEEYYDDYEDNYDYSEEDDESDEVHDDDYDNYENQLWSSADDPDWTPSPEELDMLAKEVAVLLVEYVKRDGGIPTKTLAELEDALRQFNVSDLILMHTKLQLPDTNTIQRDDSSEERYSEEESSPEYWSDEDMSVNEIDQSPPPAQYTKSGKRKRRSVVPLHFSRGHSRAGQLGQEKDHINHFGTLEKEQKIKQHQNQYQGQYRDLANPSGVGPDQWTSSEDQSHETDDVNKDPDWMPEEYYDEEYDDSEDNYYDYSEEDDESDEVHDDDYDNYENQLWSSADDPDWTPSPEELDRLAKEVAVLVLEYVKRGGGIPTKTQAELANAYRHFNVSDLILMFTKLQLVDTDTNTIQRDDSSEERYSEEESSPEYWSDEDMSVNEIDQSPPPAQYTKSGKRKRRSVVPLHFSRGHSRAGQLGQEKDHINHFGTLGQVEEINQHQYRDQANQNHGVGGGVWEGVEPLVREYQHEEVGAGVVPVGDYGYDEEGEEEQHRPSFVDWIRRNWNKAVDRVEDKVEEKWDKVGSLASSAYDAAHRTGQAVVNVARGVKHHLITAFTKFGTRVQEGVRYCIDKLTHVFDQVRGSDILDKLEQKLSEGDAHVTKFFQLIGEKIDHWKATHVRENVDEGLVVIEGEGNQHHQEGTHPGHMTQGRPQQMPDFFQEDEVLLQLKKLVEIGVLTQEDYDFLSNQHLQDQGVQRYTLE